MTRRIGFHIKRLDELFRIGTIEGVNLVELKPDKMRENGNELYSFNDKIFNINKDLAKQISAFCEDKDIQMQIHLPYENSVNPNKETGLCYGIKEHHPLLLDRFKMLAELYHEFKIGKVMTIHPPQLISKGRKLCDYHDGLEHGREFLYALDKERKLNDWDFKVGLENMAGPKKDSQTLGYNIAHLKQLLGETETIGLTVDSGHRLLSKDMSVAQMFSFAQVVSLHFHTNHGILHSKGHNDDEHEFATYGNLIHFNTYIRGIRRRNIPITCEIKNLESVTSRDIQNYVAHLRFLLD